MDDDDCLNMDSISPLLDSMDLRDAVNQTHKMDDKYLIYPTPYGLRGSSDLLELPFSTEMFEKFNDDVYLYHRRNEMMWDKEYRFYSSIKHIELCVITCISKLDNLTVDF